MKSNTFTGILTINPKNFGTRMVDLPYDKIAKLFRVSIVSCFILIFIVFLFPLSTVDGQSSNGQEPIGQVQGRGSESPRVGGVVQFKGIVTGVQEDENARGARFYSAFVQDLPGSEDGDPETSDGIAVFFGASRPSVKVGDVIAVSGVVTEYYGLTEIDYDGLLWWIEETGHSLPSPIELNPPPDIIDAAAYFEKVEGMLVKAPRSFVVGPTHEGCGFTVVQANGQPARVFRHHFSDHRSDLTHVLHNTDVSCESFPAVNYGDEVTGILGPLTYHFEQFKVVQQNPRLIEISEGPAITHTEMEPPKAGQITLATFNLDNYFDSISDTGTTAEPVTDPLVLELKQKKLAHTISQSLSCPTLVGVQEVETKHLLEELADILEPVCQFRYQVSHLDGPDVRGSDLALMSNPDQVTILGVTLQQTCTALDTGIIDTGIQCDAGLEPLFSRPPLRVDLLVSDEPLVFIVNHFKSKRGGEWETLDRRLAQAKHIRDLTESILSGDSSSAIVVVGDFNDYYRSDVMDELLNGSYLVDILDKLPESERYSYIFDGYSQLIDWIMMSPSLQPRVVDVKILHHNANYHHRLSGEDADSTMGYRSSDHDVPYVIFQMDDVEMEIVEKVPTIEPTKVPEATSWPTQSDTIIEKIEQKEPELAESVGELPKSLEEDEADVVITVQPTAGDYRGSIIPAFMILLLLAVAGGITIVIWLRRRNL